MRARTFLLIPLCALTLAAGVPAAWCAEPEQDQELKALETELPALLQERLETAKLAADALNAAYEAETVTLFNLIDAFEKLREAQLAVGSTPEEKIKALEDHLRRMQQTEQKIKVLYEVATRGGEVKYYATAKRERQSAEIALIQARLKAGR